MRLLLLGLTACSIGPSFEVIEDCATCGAGEVQRGWRYANGFENAPPPPSIASGIGFILDEELHVFDDAGVERSTTDVGDAEHVAVATNGDVYGVYEVYEGIAYQRVRKLTGANRWSVDFSSYITSPVQLVADDAAVYLVTGGSDTSLYPLSSTSGEPRWSGGWTSRVLPDEQDGVYVLTNLDRGLFGNSVARINHVGPTGQSSWVRELALPHTPTATFASIGFSDAATTSNGIVVVGWFRGPTLTVGSLIATIPEGTWGAGFVLALDSAGVPQWLHALDTIGIGDSRVCVTGDSVVIGGTTKGATDLEEDDTLIAIVDATGTLRVDRLGGPGSQRLRALAPGRDGKVWASLDARSTEVRGHMSTELVTGSRTFDGDGEMRRYVVEVQP